ncbi:hypothetical protein BJ508DRAFT_323732 [Ascobolus immersus RN42]|uniref:BTB domain-containing protein n=1 Tax=Ascobolus immersus RN42 TaxID=1160509 RepID=A0A3N4IF93_ASCIM|nr:hypothetical protein BJ508DRAFT_323732 [Ascobolus immersus RN42]
MSERKRKNNDNGSERKRSKKSTGKPSFVPIHIYCPTIVNPKLNQKSNGGLYGWKYLATEGKYCLDAELGVWSETKPTDCIDCMPERYLDCWKSGTTVEEFITITLSDNIYYSVPKKHLCKRVDYFKALVSFSGEESKSGFVKFDGGEDEFDSTVIRHFIEFLYTGEKAYMEQAKSRECRFGELERHARVYVLGQRLLMDDLRDSAFAAARSMLKIYTTVENEYCEKLFAVTKYVYENTEEETNGEMAPMRKLFASYHAYIMRKQASPRFGSNAYMATLKEAITTHPELATDIIFSYPGYRCNSVLPLRSHECSVW